MIVIGTARIHVWYVYFSRRHRNETCLMKSNQTRPCKGHEIVMASSMLWGHLFNRSRSTIASSHKLWHQIIILHLTNILYKTLLTSRISVHSSDRDVWRFSGRFGRPGGDLLLMVMFGTDDASTKDGFAWTGRYRERVNTISATTPSCSLLLCRLSRWILTHPQS